MVRNTTKILNYIKINTNFLGKTHFEKPIEKPKYTKNKYIFFNMDSTIILLC